MIKTGERFENIMFFIAITIPGITIPSSYPLGHGSILVSFIKNINLSFNDLVLL